MYEYIELVLCIVEFYKARKICSQLSFPLGLFIQAVFKVQITDVDLYTSAIDNDYSNLRGKHASRPRTLGN